MVPEDTSMLAPTVKSAGKVTSLLLSSITAFEAGRVQNTFLVPAGKLTGLSLLDDDITVSLDKEPAPTVQGPTSK